MRLSPLAALAAVLAAPLLTACTVNNPPASPVVVQERVVVPSQAVAPPVILPWPSAIPTRATGPMMASRNRGARGRAAVRPTSHGKIAKAEGPTRWSRHRAAANG